MLSLRSSSAFDLFDRIEQQLSQQLHSAERVPAAEVHETPEAYAVVLELPGVDKAAIEVKAEADAQPEAVAVAERLGVREVWFTHVCHDLPHAETNRSLPAGMALAHDGLVLDVEVE